MNFGVEANDDGSNSVFVNFNQDSSYVLFLFTICLITISKSQTKAVFRLVFIVILIYILVINSLMTLTYIDCNYD